MLSIYANTMRIASRTDDPYLKKSPAAQTDESILARAKAKKDTLVRMPGGTAAASSRVPQVPRRH